MKKKHFIAPALALGLIGGAIAVPSAIFADSDAAVTDSATSSAATQAPATTPTGDHVITPQATDGQIVDRPVAGFNDSADFDIKGGYGYVRLYLRNTGNTTISFTVNQGSVSGAEKYSGTVKPGKTFDEILNSSKAWSAGKFYVSLSSGSGSMSGKLGVRTSTNTNF
ncbi:MULTISPECIES: hypothetical protein [Paenibacillus]|uniref:Pxo1-15 n=1 Tax=Paenibacillus polymyxa TaxID=1406 RepID=A0ABX2Z7U3_PAEPO|nr:MULTISPECIES: hypothetical protein [Paenibacillus]MBY7736732.1 hypothetical protein [Paenibacillus polymyxa]MDG0053445.1 hypothetical protein [Paenibacillus sp. P2(2022)]ODA07350.1 hypothetical protein A7312_09675 [Paenibacillus polymyxa]OME69631.1 hypothetical protein BK119_14260 [Paenibacillus peoriae]